jgi:mannose-6-phosphate isomerase-like protein (cupin superfamily)
MIQKADTLAVEMVDLSRNGGRGCLMLRHILLNDKAPHGRCFEQITMEQGAAMALHTHRKKTEFYYILQGAGTVTHDDGEAKVNAGDVIITGDGESHAIRNERDEPLVFIALILYD